MKTVVLTAGAAWVLTVALVGGVQDGIRLEVSHRARSLQPGEVVVLEVRPSQPPVTMRATAFGHSVRFFPSQDDGMWRGLVGVDLATEAGVYTIALRASMSDGQSVRTTYTLTVEQKEFPTRPSQRQSELRQPSSRGARPHPAVKRRRLPPSCVWGAGTASGKGGSQRRCQVSPRAVSDDAASTTVSHGVRTPAPISAQAKAHPSRHQTREPSCWRAISISQGTS